MNSRRGSIDTVHRRLSGKILERIRLRTDSTRSDSDMQRKSSRISFDARKSSILSGGLVSN